MHVVRPPYDVVVGSASLTCLQIHTYGSDVTILAIYVSFEYQARRLTS